MENEYWVIIGESGAAIRHDAFIGFPDKEQAEIAVSQSDKECGLIAYCKTKPFYGAEWGKDIHIIASRNRCGWRYFEIGEALSWEDIWRGDCEGQYA